MRRIFQIGAGLLVFLLSACMKDDISDCDVKIRLSYTYNMKNADAFSEEVTEAQVWVFDAAQRLVAQYQKQKSSWSADGYLSIPHLRKGDYTFVAMARSVDKREAYSDFEIPSLSQGAPIDSLWARLQHDEQGNNACRLNAFLLGTQSVSITGVAQHLTISMMKCTNTLRVLLVPADPEGRLEADQLDFSIEGKNGWLTYQGDTYCEVPVVYRPYYQETLKENSGIRGTVQQVVVAELNTSRIFYHQEPRLIVRHRESHTEILNINLAWLLSLQAIEEHQEEWSNQEYLDRQDEFVLTFIVNGQTWVQSQIIVNGWVLSFSDVNL